MLSEYSIVNGIDGSIFFPGWSNDIQTSLLGLDIFVLPSNWEGMPLAILEAMAMRLPIITSDIPGNADLIVNGINGLLFEANNSSDLADKIKLLIENPEISSGISSNALSDAHQKYSLDVHIAKIDSIYRDL